jgi:signal transduction histidine kinase
MIAELALAGWALSAVVAHRALAARERTARACHEVRGPLTAAGLALQLMERHGEAPPERLAALDEQLRRARLALEDLVHRSGCSGDRLQRLPVAQLLGGLHVAWSPVCAAQGRPLVVGTAPPGLSVLADRTRLAQALGNLIANALEHGQGAVEVRPRVAGGQLRIEVRDGGGGVERPLAEILRGARAGLGRRGRGLAIAADIAARHGGSVSTAPSADGAALVFELPLLGVLGAVEEQAAR